MVQHSVRFEGFEGFERFAVQLPRRLTAKKVIGIVSAICILTVILILCYRRSVFKAVEDTLVEKIQSETIRSIDKFTKAKIEKEKLTEEEDAS